MGKIKTFMEKEFMAGYSWFDKLFMVVMLALQIVVFIFNPDSILSIVAGISGVISVVLCAKGKISFYFIGFVQNFSYMFLAWQNCFYGEVIENVFYVVTMIWGIFVWKKHIVENDDGSQNVEALKFTPIQWVLSVLGTIVATIGMGY